VFRLCGLQPGREAAALNDAILYLHAMANGQTVLTRNVWDFDVMHQILPEGRILFYDSRRVSTAQKRRGQTGHNQDTRMRRMATFLTSRSRPPTGRGIVVACCVVLSLAGCIRSKGPLLPVETASAPLPAGLYIIVSNLNSRTDLPAVQGPVRVTIQGTTYIAVPPKTEDQTPLRFHLIKATNAGEVYILQTDTGDKQGYRDILVGVVGKDGFCSKDIRNFPPDAVANEEIVSKAVLLRFLADYAADIASTVNEVCYIRKS
jgi:hypothetical protein